MVWVSILLGIIQLIPTLLPIIKQIWDAIHGHPAKVGEFISLIESHAANPAGAEKDVRAFHAVHVLGQAPAA